MNIKKLIFLLVLVLAQGLCFGPIAAASPAPESTLVAASSQDKKTDWSYQGEEGPAHWGETNPACKGTSQSPIDLRKANQENLTNITFHYQPMDVRIVNNGHTVQVNYEGGGYIEVDGKRYEALQYHYHAPSEHTIAGKTFPAELHIVHKNAEGQLAVVGILLTAGLENPPYENFISHLPTQEGPAQTLALPINAADLLPAVQTTYRYSGSLTTPPCTEGVSWFVMDTPVELDPDQLAGFKRAIAGNNRPIQPLNTRSLIEDSTS